MFSSSSSSSTYPQNRGSLNQPLIQEEDEETNRRKTSYNPTITGRVVRVESFPSPPPTSVYAHKIEETQDGYVIDVEEVTVIKRRRFRVYTFTGVAIVLFLLLFFLIPRSPEMTYKSTAVYFTQIPLQVEQTYSIKNTNFYSVTLTSFDDLEITSAFYQVDGTNTVFQFQAFGSGPSSLTIGSLKTATLTLLYNSTSTPLDAVVISSQCSSEEGVPLYTSGSLDSTTLLGYKRKLSFSWIYVYFCS